MYMYPYKRYICKQMHKSVLTTDYASARNLHFSVQLTSSRFGNLTWLIHTLLEVSGGRANNATCIPSAVSVAPVV